MPEKTVERALEGKVAIVTGGTRGIGFAIAERLAREGAKIAICGAKEGSADKARERLAKITEAYGETADVSNYADVKRFVANVKSRFGAVHILVNNAGIGVFRSISELTPAEWDRMMAVNLSGAYYCSHETLPILRQQGEGDIINISSLAGRNPFAGGGGYNASKFGMNGFSEAMMLDHRNDGVRVSYIMPGSVETEFGGPGGQTAASWKIAPEDIAEVVSTLLKMPRRTTVSRVEIRPSRPPSK
jgi:NAD(P)-dependent dehydrogenase (short-subunit alcohol dehydrogenase family)